MNPRQRRGVLLMIVAGIGALAVFLSVFYYAQSLYEDLGKMRSALRLTEDVAPYQPIDGSMVEKFDVPAKYFDDNQFFSELDQVLQQKGQQDTVSATKLAKGAVLQKSMVIPAPKLEEGEREIAIMIDAETGVAGKVDVGSMVDIYATIPGGKESQSCAQRILEHVEVLEIGKISSETDDSGTQSSVVPVTFRLSPDDSLQLTYAESFSESVRLALVSPEGAGKAKKQKFCTEDQAEQVSGDEQSQDN